MAERALQGTLTFVGFMLSFLAIIYFAIEYVRPISDWTKIAALILGAVSFTYLGLYIQQTMVGGPFFEGPRLRWLRPAIVLYLLALLSVIWADIVFLGLDEFPRPMKVLVTLLAGIGLIIVAARARTRRPEPNEPQ